MTVREVIALNDVGPESAARWCVRLAQGQMTPEEHDALDAWLAADPVNRTHLDRAVATWHGVEGFAGAPEIVAMRGQALESARRAHRMQWARAFLSSREWMGVAAAALLLIVVGLGVGLSTSLMPQTYQTGIGERRVVVLEDGSRISLDAASEVKVRYTGDQRRLWLERGRAKFDVAKNPLRPFSVAVKGEVVVATGTSFSVELVKSQVRVVLYEGHIAVLAQPQAGTTLRPLRIGRDHLPTDAALTPGHELITLSPEEAGVGAKAVPPVVVSEIDPVRSRSWEEGQLVFDDEPLTTAVERVNRYSNQKVIVGDSVAGAARISGVFNAGDTSAFVDGVTSLLPVKARPGDHAVELVTPPRQNVRNSRTVGSGR